MGRTCHCCQRERPNEFFGGRGLRSRVCIRCRQTLGKEGVKQEIQHTWIDGLYRQSNVSQDNLVALEKAIHNTTDQSRKDYYSLVLRVYRLYPHRKKRLSRLRKNSPDLYQECVQAHLFFVEEAMEEDDFSSFSDKNLEPWEDCPSISPDDEWRWGIITGIVTPSDTDV